MTALALAILAHRGAIAATKEARMMARTHRNDPGRARAAVLREDEELATGRALLAALDAPNGGRNEE